MAVSAEFGLEGWCLFDRPINSAKYCQVFEMILNQGKNFVVFADNASIHNSKYTKNYL